jgi:G3E family GTPase
MPFCECCRSVNHSGLFFQKEEEKLRNQLRKENQQRRMRERSNARGLTASYLEPDRYEDDEEALEQSLLEMKKHYKKGLAKSTHMHYLVNYFFFLITFFYTPCTCSCFRLDEYELLYLQVPIFILSGTKWER